MFLSNPKKSITNSLVGFKEETILIVILLTQIKSWHNWHRGGSIILKSRLAVREQRAKYTKDEIILVAEYGKELLQKNVALKRGQSDYETVQKEKQKFNLQVVVENSTF